MLLIQGNPSQRKGKDQDGRKGSITEDEVNQMVKAESMHLVHQSPNTRPVRMNLI